MTRFRARARTIRCAYGRRKRAKNRRRGWKRRVGSGASGWNAGGTSLVATTDSEVAVRDSAGQVRQVATPAGHFNGGAWARSASVYAFVDDERVVVMDGTTWSVIMEKPTNVRRTLGVAITPDGSLVAVSSTTDIMVLSVPSGEIRYRVRAISPALAFSP